VAAPPSSPLLGASLFQTIESASIVAANLIALYTLLNFLVLTPSKFVVRQVLQRCLWLHRFLIDSCVPSLQIRKVACITAMLVTILPLRHSCNASSCSLRTYFVGSKYYYGVCNCPNSSSLHYGNILSRAVFLGGAPPPFLLPFPCRSCFPLYVHISYYMPFNRLCFMFLGHLHAFM
jgi:hypothetical protein